MRESFPPIDPSRERAEARANEERARLGGFMNSRFGVALVNLTVMSMLAGTAAYMGKTSLEHGDLPSIDLLGTPEARRGEAKVAGKLLIPPHTNAIKGGSIRIPARYYLRLNLDDGKTCDLFLERTDWETRAINDRVRLEYRVGRTGRVYVHRYEGLP